MYSSCAIEYFGRNQYLQAVCDTPDARITGCVSSLGIQVDDSPWNHAVACTRANRVILLNLCEETANKLILMRRNLTVVKE